MSTHDGQNTENPVNPSGDTQPQRAVNILQEATGSQSRRKFLRAAVMSGVGVATVATTAGVAAACQSAVPSVFGQPVGTSQASGTDPCSMCFELTNFTPVVDPITLNKGDAGPGSFFIWFTGHNLPVGTYSLEITQSPGGPTFPSSPFKYPNGGGNNAFLYERSAGKAAKCPTFVGGHLPGDEKEHANTLALLSPYHIGSTADLQWAIHIDRDDTVFTSESTYTFTGTLKNDQGQTICTAHVSVTFTPKATATPTPKPTATATATPTPMPTATPTATPTPMPTATPTPHP